MLHKFTAEEIAIKKIIVQCQLRSARIFNSLCQKFIYCFSWSIYRL